MGGTGDLTTTFNDFGTPGVDLCGNGDPGDPGEECEDGNTINTDACISCIDATCGK
jgi:hypothetical protein